MRPSKGPGGMGEQAMSWKRTQDEEGGTKGDKVGIYSLLSEARSGRPCLI
jgi:hypothetical protein